MTPLFIVTWVVAGGASAAGGWLFHKVFKTNRQLRSEVDELKNRVR